MPNRPVPDAAFWLAFLLAVLLIAPRLGSGAAADSSRADRLPTRFDLSVPPPTTQLGAALPADNAVPVTDLPAEEEEPDRADVRDEPRAPFLIPSPSLKSLDQRLTSLRSAPSLYPLRC